MNELTNNLIKTFKPCLAIIAYTPTFGDWRECYLESHAIGEDGKLQEGKPLQQSTIQGMVDVFFDENKNRSEVKGLMPDNILQFELRPGGNYKMIWYRAAEKRHIYFAEQLHLPSGPAWAPPLIYVADQGHLSIYAFAHKNGRPTEKEQLYLAPFHNVGDGSVCLGSAQVKKPSQKTFANLTKYWEDLFWLSEFTHLAGSSNPTKTNLNSIWHSLIGTETKWEQLDELKPFKGRVKTLNDLL